ncbi:acyltransferase [Clostridium perfringens]|nr:acyltransferase [Clostridium perfringens]ELC8426479.1 acyltransferase [Clostridium perfringens]
MIGSLIKEIRSFIFTNICLKRVRNCGKNVRVNHWCDFSCKTTIGNNCHFNGIKITGGGKVVIGNNFHSGRGVLILTSNHNYDSGSAIPYDDTTIDGDVKIEDNVWVGQNVTILQGVTIGEGAIIQAGSVVVSDILPCSIAGGHPAREFKKRDQEHYYKLKQEEKFF